MRGGVTTFARHTVVSENRVTHRRRVDLRAAAFLGRGGDGCRCAKHRGSHAGPELWPQGGVESACVRLPEADLRTL